MVSLARPRGSSPAPPPSMILPAGGAEGRKGTRPPLESETVGLRPSSCPRAPGFTSGSFWFFLVKVVDAASSEKMARERQGIPGAALTTWSRGDRRGPRREPGPRHHPRTFPSQSVCL